MKLCEIYVFVDHSSNFRRNLLIHPPMPIERRCFYLRVELRERERKPNLVGFRQVIVFARKTDKQIESSYHNSY